MCEHAVSTPCESVLLACSVLLAANLSFTGDDSTVAIKSTCPVGGVLCMTAGALGTAKGCPWHASG